MASTKQRDAEREEAVAELRKILKPGDTVFTVLRKVSSSGMSRQIDVYVIKNNRPRYLTGWVAQAVGYRRADGGHGPLQVGGAGMDMGFSVVYNLSSALFRDRFKCIGLEKRCPANDHNNDYNGFSHRYDEEHDPEGKRRYRGDPESYEERSAYAAAKSEAWQATEAERYSRTRKHSDGGYALKQEWL